MKKKYILSFLMVAALLIVAGVGLRYAFYQGYIRMNYPSLDEYPVQGIDISHHQGMIDWKTVDKNMVQFAFIKATEGENHKDSLFLENQTQARQNGIIAGAYHYFTFCRLYPVFFKPFYSIRQKVLFYNYLLPIYFLFLFAVATHCEKYKFMPLFYQFF